MNGLIEESYILNIAASNPTLSFYVQFTSAPHIQITGYRNWELITTFSGEVTVSNVHLYAVDAYSHVETTFYGCVNAIGY